MRMCMCDTLCVHDVRACTAHVTLMAWSGMPGCEYMYTPYFLLACASSSKPTPLLVDVHSSGHVPAASTDELLSEVSNLVEAPVVVVGAFDPSFLALPK